MKPADLKQFKTDIIGNAGRGFGNLSITGILPLLLQLLLSLAAVRIPTHSL